MECGGDLPPGRCYGQPRNGRVDSAGEQATGCFQLYWTKLPPRPAANRCGGWSERREELGPRELRRPVSRAVVLTKERQIGKGAI